MHRSDPSVLAETTTPAGRLEASRQDHINSISTAAESLNRSFNYDGDEKKMKDAVKAIKRGVRAFERTYGW